jgi:hypothetical protein
MIHVYSRRSVIVEPQTSMSYSLCFYDTSNIRDLIIGITIPSSISLPTMSFTPVRQKGLTVMGMFSRTLTMEAFVVDLQPLVMSTADVRPYYHPYQQHRRFLGHSPIDGTS